jgi:hypothetical protein
MTVRLSTLHSVPLGEVGKLKHVPRGFFCPKVAYVKEDFYNRVDGLESLRLRHQYQIGRTCSTNREKRMHIGYWWESQNERDH